jgi:hypothetical protein
MAEQKSMRERMLGGELYIADDPGIARDSDRAQRLTHLINTIDPTGHDRRREQTSTSTRRSQTGRSLRDRHDTPSGC